MIIPAPYQTLQRWRSLRTHKIHALPIAILMPHSACNCRCVMCDIWKDNKNLKQLTREDIESLLVSFRRLHTKQVLLSGGEALLNQRFFELCALLKKEGLYLTLLSTGILLKKYAAQLVTAVDEIIVSLDGDEPLHDAIRNIPGAYAKLREGIGAIRALAPRYKITARTVIHKLNFRSWDRIIESALSLGLNQVSFLPADVSSTAFNRETPWNEKRQYEVQLSQEELPELEAMTERLLQRFDKEFRSGFIAERPEKIKKIHAYYSAIYGQNPFPQKQCNAPWVSAVVEADGNVRPCFFLDTIGNIRERSLDAILNDAGAVALRKQLQTNDNETCKRCVCYLHLAPAVNPVPRS